MAARGAALSEKLYAAEKNVALIRVAVIVLNSLVYLSIMGHEGTIEWMAYSVIVVANLYGFAVVAFEPYRRYPLLLESAFTSIADAGLITLWLWSTGGLASPFYVLWYVSIAAIAFRYNPKETMVISGGYAAAYLGLLGALGEIAVDPTAVVVRTSYIFFVGGLGALFSMESLKQTQAKVEMQRLMQDARTAERKFRGVLEAAPNAIVIADRDDRIVLVNSMAERMFGHEREDLIGSKVGALLGAGSREAYDMHRSHLAARREASTLMADDLTGVRADGTTFPVEISISPLETEEGVLVTNVFHDITDRKRAEEERIKRREQVVELERLKEVDEFKTMFINTAAHELGTPLTPIKLQLHILRANKEGLDDRQSKAVDVLDRNVDRLADLVDDVLEVARIQADRLGLDRERTDLNPLVLEVVETFEETARSKGIDLETRLTPNLVAVADAKRITQVLFNFISNALKFTPEGGTVTVETARGDETAVVRVVDTGRGLSEEQKADLFKPFSQVHDRMEVTAKGSGLGLYISKGTIELHNGHIWCHSDGPGTGATFGFALPLEDTADTVAPPPEAAPDRADRGSIAERAEDLV